MKEKLKENKGITLIALVVTIIILLILAGVTINVALGDNGLFAKSKESVEKHKEASAKEQVSVAIGEYLLDINAVDMTAEERDNTLKEVLSNLGPTSVASDDEYYETEVDGYIFWINRTTQEIVAKGKSSSIKPTAIAVKNSNIEITIGETQIIGLDLTPSDSSERFIKYTSSDDTIATVNNGVVKGIAIGTATITIESTEDSSVKATCTVTVKEVEVSSISLDKSELTISINKTSEALKVTFNPSNATDKSITWTSNEPSVATVNNDGKVTGVEEGTAEITATSANGKTATCQITVVEDGVDKYINIDGTRTLVNTKDVYGSQVTGYTCGRTDVSWQLFYIDNYTENGEEKSKVYLVASDYAMPPVNNATNKMITGGNSSYPKAYKFGTDTSDNSLLGEYSGNIPDNTFTQKWLSEWKGTSASSQANLRATNYLLNQSVWSEYKGAKADYAFGGPTLPLFAASYNDICKKSTKLGYQKINTGYQVKIGNGSFEDSQSGYGDESTQKGIYFKGKKNTNSAGGMWLASPSSSDKWNVMCVTIGKVRWNCLCTDYVGVRPVVSLESDVQLTKNSDGSFTIKP